MEKGAYLSKETAQQAISTRPRVSLHVWTKVVLDVSQASMIPSLVMKRLPTTTRPRSTSSKSGRGSDNVSNSNHNIRSILQVDGWARRQTLDFPKGGIVEITGSTFWASQCMFPWRGSNGRGREVPVSCQYPILNILIYYVSLSRQEMVLSRAHLYMVYNQMSRDPRWHC